MSNWLLGLFLLFLTKTKIKQPRGSKYPFTAAISQ
jgi:hypothetical protein